MLAFLIAAKWSTLKPSPMTIKIACHQNVESEIMAECEGRDRRQETGMFDLQSGTEHSKV